MRSAWTCRGSQTMKESQLLREKTTSSVFVSTCSNPLHMPSFIGLHTHATAGHVTSFACTQLADVQTLPIDRWHDRTTRSRRSTRSVAIDLKHETLPANRARLLDQTGAKQWPLFSRSRQSLSGHDRSNARRPRTGRGRGP